MSSQDWSTRVRVRCGTGCRAQGGGPSFPVGEPLGLGADRSTPAALELALGALGGELLQLFAGLCRREGLSLDSLELSLHATLSYPLVALGVIGAEGVPVISALRGACHAVSLDTTGPELMPELWNQALARAVLLGTWRRACPVEIRFNAT